MNRRTFISKSAGAGLLAATGLSWLTEGTAAGAEEDSRTPYDLVAVMGGEPGAMYARGIEGLGGMEAFVKPGQTVVVKPNIGWDRTPEMGANTNPELVASIVADCLRAGASEVFVFDHSCDNWVKSYASSGIEAAAKEAGATVVPAASQTSYRQVTFPGKVMTSALVHEKVIDCDVFIDVPVIKHHDGAQVSLAMKNLMGIVWDRGFLHRNDLQQCIADIVTYRKPDLTVIDGYRVMQKNGPKGVTRADAALKKTLILSRDIVAADAAAAKIFGVEPADIPHIRIAAEMGLGKIELDKLNILRINLKA
ncbi:MAG: DUF362 domain-containing protein [Bacteroidales bacterium]|nr:DUF362 domain-containing protein [Bacteroidales bacterium]